jgi:hypothetical protein
MTYYTPGPWIPVMKLGFPTIQAASGERVADIICQAGKRHSQNGVEELGANARLIAAAPELLEAAKEALSWFLMWEENEETAQPEIERLSKAIAKAEGSTVSPR